MNDTLGMNDHLNQVFRDVEKCPLCNADLTRDWTGKLGIIDPEKAKTAKEVKIDEVIKTKIPSRNVLEEAERVVP